MTLKDAVKLALIYRQIPQDVFKAYADLIDTATEKHNMEDAKSVRFENVFRKFTSVFNKDSVKFTLPNPLDPESEIEAVSYAVIIKGKEGAPDKVETGRRYMFYSDKFTEAFSVRVFDVEQKYNAFKRQNRITILKEFEFRGAQFALYRSNNSDVDRVAIYCDKECDLSPNDLAAELKYSVDLGNANKTAVFS